LLAPTIIFVISLNQEGSKKGMCRNIKTLHNFKPPATEEEVRASAIQFVRKLSGFNKPSKANEAAFNRAVDEVARVATELLDSLVTNAPPRDREVEAAKARARTALRFRGAPAV
jgi:hypothetical protein